MRGGARGTWRWRRGVRRGERNVRRSVRSMRRTRVREGGRLTQRTRPVRSARSARSTEGGRGGRLSAVQLGSIDREECEGGARGT